MFSGFFQTNKQQILVKNSAVWSGGEDELDYPRRSVLPLVIDSGPVHFPGCRQKYREGGRGMKVLAAALETRERILTAETGEDEFRNSQTNSDEAEILRRQQLFNRIAPVYDNVSGLS